MNGVDVLSLYCFLHSLEQGFETVFFTNVVPGCECVGGVETNTKRKLRADAYDRFKVFETMADAITLAGSIFQKNFQLSEPQPFARDLQTCRAQRDAVSFTGTARTSRMDHQVIDTEQQRSFNFFTKRST